MNNLHQDTVVRKMVSFNQGKSKAMLAFRNGRKKAIIEYYEPSMAYCSRIKELNAALRLMSERKQRKEDKFVKRMRISRNSELYHFHQASKLMEAIFGDRKKVNLYEKPLGEIKLDWNNVKLG